MLELQSTLYATVDRAVAELAGRMLVHFASGEWNGAAIAAVGQQAICCI